MNLQIEPRHERELKKLEKALHKICEEHKQIITLADRVWSRSIELFVTIEALRSAHRDMKRELKGDR